MTTDKDEIYVVLQKKSYSIIIKYSGMAVLKSIGVADCIIVVQFFVIAQTTLIFCWCLTGDRSEIY